MRLLIIQHENDSPAGHTIEWLETRKVDYDIVRVDQTVLPPAAHYDGLIVLGGEMNVDQEEKYPWLKGEKNFISAWIQSKKPLLGICLGGQLIADILGARVSRHDFWEIGWCDVQVTKESGLPELGSILPAFQWHGYSFDIPEGAQLAVTGKYWANQGFTYGDNVLGVQFHPEANESFVKDCAQAQSKSGKVSPTMLSSEDILSRLEDLNKLKSWYFKVLDKRFLKIK